MNLLLYFFGVKIKISVADPLDLKPVPKVVVTTALKGHLQVVDVLFLEAAAWCVCILVEAYAIPQATLQSGLKAASHGVAHNDGQQHEHSEERRDGKIRLQEGLPARKSTSIQSVLADL